PATLSFPPPQPAGETPSWPPVARPADSPPIPDNTLRPGVARPAADPMRTTDGDDATNYGGTPTNTTPSNFGARWPTRIGEYNILGILGRGGMGVVYRAVQRTLNRPVALKMIKSGMYAEWEEIDRFQAEARAIASLRHPNIVQVYEIGTENGCPFF